MPRPASLTRISPVLEEIVRRAFGEGRVELPLESEAEVRSLRARLYSLRMGVEKQPEKAPPWMVSAIAQLSFETDFTEGQAPMLVVAMPHRTNVDARLRKMLGMGDEEALMMQRLMQVQAEAEEARKVVEAKASALSPEMLARMRALGQKV